MDELSQTSINDSSMVHITKSTREGNATTVDTSTVSTQRDLSELVLQQEYHGKPVHNQVQGKINAHKRIMTLLASLHLCIALVYLYILFRHRITSLNPENSVCPGIKVVDWAVYFSLNCVLLAVCGQSAYNSNFEAADIDILDLHAAKMKALAPAPLLLLITALAANQHCHYFKVDERLMALTVIQLISEFTLLRFYFRWYQNTLKELSGVER